MRARPAIMSLLVSAIAAGIVVTVVAMRSPETAARTDQPVAADFCGDTAWLWEGTNLFHVLYEQPGTKSGDPSDLNSALAEGGTGRTYVDMYERYGKLPGATPDELIAWWGYVRDHKQPGESARDFSAAVVQRC